ncbi:PilC/PilY family type IV pilus protein [bacterium]|nr:PilC/PilY family type IV pilus protein [bacterium]
MSANSCNDFGNASYWLLHEALRYLNFDTSYGNTVRSGNVVADTEFHPNTDPLPFSADPIPSAEWCSNTTVIDILSGPPSQENTHNSKVSDQDIKLPPAQIIGADGASADKTSFWIDKLASDESLNGGTYFLPTFLNSSGNLDSGYLGRAASRVCTPVELRANTDNVLSNVLGVCPQLPGLGGGYSISGLAYRASQTDLRPNYKTKRSSYYGSDSSVKGTYFKNHQPILYHFVNLEDSSPTFTLRPTNDKEITISPLIQTYILNSGTQEIHINSTVDFQQAAITDIQFAPNSLLENQSGSGLYGAFIVYFEESWFGSQYDMDGAIYYRYCSFSECQNRFPDFPRIVTNRANVHVWVHGLSAALAQKIRAGYNTDGRVQIPAPTGTAATIVNPGFDTELTGSVFHFYRYEGDSQDCNLNPVDGGTRNTAPYGEDTNQVYKCVDEPPLSDKYGKRFRIDQTDPMYPTSGNPQIWKWYWWNGSYYTDEYSASGQAAKPFVSNKPQWLEIKPGNTTASFLRSPYWYAAKYSSGFGWDLRHNIDRKRVADGVPDNYHEVQNLSLLSKSLESIQTTSNFGLAVTTAPAASQYSLKDGVNFYFITTDPTHWRSDIYSFKLKSTGEFEASESWVTKSKKASNTKFKSPASREIYTLVEWENSTSGTGWTSVSAKLENDTSDHYQRPTFNSYFAAHYPSIFYYMSSEDLLNALRGDTDNDLVYTDQGINTTSTGEFRSNRGYLGDVVNSDPLLITDYYGAYDFTDVDGHDTYRNYYKKKFTNGKLKHQLLLVNSNDGMLHAFNANVEADANSGRMGQEVFAYLPYSHFCDYDSSSTSSSTNNAFCEYNAKKVNKIFSQLDADYTHEYTLDGQISYGDVYINNEWQTVALSSGGLGGKFVFALNLSDFYTESYYSDARTMVSNMKNQGNAGGGSALTMWELFHNYNGSSSSSNHDKVWDSNIGHITGPITIGLMKNGDWAAIFGNGYSNDNNSKTSLFIVNIKNGNVIKRIDVSSARQGKGYQGLSAPGVYINRMTGYVEFAYAGDQKGNVWKFDLNSDNVSDWKVANNGAAFFTAKSDSGQFQPISAQIEISDAPPGKKGVMIYFGTGKFFENYDPENKNIQSFYGLWDDGSSTISGLSELKARKFIGKTDYTDGIYSSSRSVAKSASEAAWWLTKKGWYLPLFSSGERVVYPAVVHDKQVIFASIEPNADACGTGFLGWVTYLDYHTGAAPDYDFIDWDQDGQYDDEVVEVKEGDIPGSSPTNPDNKVNVRVNSIGSTQINLSRPPTIVKGDGFYGNVFATYDADTGAPKGIVIRSLPSKGQAVSSWRQIN